MLHPKSLNRSQFSAVSHTLTLEEFLALVVPRRGVKLAATNTGRISTVTHRPVWTNDDSHTYAALAADILRRDENPKYNVYFALGGYAENSITEHAGRAQINVLWQRSFWIDVDVEEGNSKKYATVREAAENIYAFAQHLNLHDPLIVRSGGGLHVYWPLADDVPVTQWQPVADALKARAVAYKLKFDPTRTADAASVLRPITTHNRKTDPARVVTLAKVGDPPVPLSVIAAALGTSVMTHIETGIRFDPSDLPVEIASLALTVGQTIATKAAPLVFQRCAQMRWTQHHMKDGSEKVPEPLWRAGLSILKRCHDGEREAHLYSKPYPGYSREETQSKYDLLGDTPSTCASFNSLNPDLCGKCPHYDRIKSPIQLGEQAEELAIPSTKLVSEVVTRTEVEVSEEGSAEPKTKTIFGAKVIELEVASVNPKLPFKRTAAGISKSVKEYEVDPETGKIDKEKPFWVDQVIVPVDVYPMFMAETEDGTFSIRWSIQKVEDPGSKRDIQVSKYEMAAPDRLRDTLLNKSFINVAKPPVMLMLQDFMLSYVDQIDSRSVQRQPTKMGWEGLNGSDYSKLSFVAGTARLTFKNGAITRYPVYPSESIKSVAAASTPAGGLEGWAEAAAVYNDPHKSLHVLSVLLGIGSFMMAFTGREGIVVAVTGRTGTGKSVVQKLIASVWAAPSNRSVVISGDSTVVGVVKHAEALNNLPVLLDEVRFEKREDISRVVMILANGRERNRGRIAKSAGGTTVISSPGETWCSTTVMTTNNDITGMLTSTIREAEGELGRIIQITPRQVHQGGWGDYNAWVEALEANHGIVGPVLVERVLADPAGEVARLRSYEALILEAVHARGVIGMNSATMRLHLAAYATAVWSLYHLRKIGAVTWSPAVLLDDIVTTITNSLTVLHKSRDWAYDFLIGFYNEQRGNIVRVAADGPMLNGIPMSSTRDVNNKLVGRYEMKNSTLMLETKTVKQALEVPRKSIQELKDGLKVLGAEVTDKVARLEAGLSIGSTTTTRVLVITGLGDIFNDEGTA